MADLSSAHPRSQAKCQLVQTSYIKQISFFLVFHSINISLTKLSWSAWENLDLSHVHRPRCIQSVLTYSVKILPYRPTAQLIRARVISYDQILDNRKDLVENNQALQ